MKQGEQPRPSSKRHLARAREVVAEGRPLPPQHAERVFARVEELEAENAQLRAALPAAPASEGAQPSQKGESP